MDVKRAADLYSQGRSLRQIGAELEVPWTAVSHQLRSAGITMRRGAPAHPASTQHIVELRDQGLTWNEVAKQVGMTVSGAWSRYRRARPPKPPRLGRWQQVLADALDHNFAIGVRPAVADHLGRVPTRAELTAAPRAAQSFAASGRARVLHVRAQMPTTPRPLLLANEKSRDQPLIQATDSAPPTRREPSHRLPRVLWARVRR